MPKTKQQPPSNNSKTTNNNSKTRYGGYGCRSESGHHVMGRLQETVTHVLKGVSDELTRFPKK